MLPQIIIKQKCTKRLKSDFPWIFSNELTAIPKLAPGTIVEVVDERGESYGSAFYNPHSLISLRLLFTDKNIDTDFFIERISKALKFRLFIMPAERMFRLVFGESDFLPGLIIDKYEDYYSVQMLSAGMDLLKNEIIDALKEVDKNLLGIIEKNNSGLRALEGLNESESVLYGNIPEEIISQENGIKLNLTLLGGQKTGYYLDQKENRSYIRKISNGLRVLDCFTNQGGFALNAGISGAKEVLAIDSSKPALEIAERNAKLNSLDNVTFQSMDVFDYLEKSSKDNNLWDLIILDPPAFAKTKKNIPTARAAYIKLNKSALSCISRGGFLATSSCSQHISENEFFECISIAALKANRNLRLIHRGEQAPDHPILISMPETNYLKFFVFQVI